MACALHGWIGVRSGLDAAAVGPGVGGAFRSTVGGLRGVSVWLDRAPGQTELVLNELGPDGVSVGRELRRARASDIDERGMVRFLFDPIVESAGQRYLFMLSCGRCPPDEETRMFFSRQPRGRGGLVTGERVDAGATPASAPVYEELPPAPVPTPALRATRQGPGRWRVDVTGARPSLVVVAESYFPGWTAKVDGKPTSVMQADGAFLGVAVGAGTHRVVLAYHRSATAPIGLAFTAATLLVCAVALVAPRSFRRLSWRRKPQPVLSD
jgi:hypothetical protein